MTRSPFLVGASVLSLLAASPALAQQQGGAGGGAGGSGISALTNDVSASGSGSVVATVNSFNGGSSIQTLMGGAGVSANYYLGFGQTSSNGGVSAGTLRIYCAPLITLVPLTINSIAARMTTGGGTGGVAFAVYANSAGQPTGNPIASTASVSDAGSAGNMTPAATTQTTPTIPAGLNWQCTEFGDTTVNFQAPSLLSSLAAAVVGAASQATISSTSSNLFFNYEASISAVGTWPTLSGGMTPLPVSVAAMLQLKAN